jgi:RNA polymerase sigma-70 factor (ECF subfamily)
MEPKRIIADVSLALEGNQQAYRALFDYLAPILRKTIKRKIYGIQSHLVQDILQDIFVKLFLNLHSYKPGKNLTSWAISIALHHVIDLSRKRKPDVIYSDNLEIYDSLSSEALSDGTQLESVAEIDVFDISKKYLDDRSERIILDKYLFGLKQKQIAIKVNKPIGSISGMQSHAIEQLKRRINELGLDRTHFR